MEDEQDDLQKTRLKKVTHPSCDHNYVEISFQSHAGAKGDIAFYRTSSFAAGAREEQTCTGQISSEAKGDNLPRIMEHVTDRKSIVLLRTNVTTTP